MRQRVDRVDHVADRLGLQTRQVERAAAPAGFGDQERALGDALAAVVIG